MQDLLPNPRDMNLPPLPNILKDVAELADKTMSPLNAPPASDDFAAMKDLILSAGASNSWVVDGKGTKTGKPMLANDPHLGMTAPTLWYLTHLQLRPNSRDRHNMVGATIPGMPLVVLGYNDHMAWSATNAYSDVQDFYLEQRHPTNKNLYRTPDGYAPFETREERFEVRFGTDVTQTLLSTRHGPVMPPHFQNHGGLLPDDTVLSLQWTAFASDDHSLNLADTLWDVKSVDDFNTAMDDFVGPIQAMIVADTKGQSAMIVPGRLPIRAGLNKIAGRLPSPGWSVLYDWQGYAPKEERLIRPVYKAGFLASANARLTSGRDAHPHSYDWKSSHRLNRINALLYNHGAKFSLRDHQEFQTDRYSPAYVYLRNSLITLLKDKDQGPHAKWIQRLKNWDGFMDKNSNLPLVLSAWHRETIRLLLADELGDHFKRFWRANPDQIAPMLLGQSHRDWCNNINTETVIETCQEIALQGLSQALSDLEARFGKTPDQWRWGEAHKVVNRHMPLSLIPVVGDLFSISREISGGPFTINRAQGRFSSDHTPYATGHGAGFRGVYDLARLEQSLFALSTGQSGWPFSRHYSDMADLWAAGQMIRIATDPRVIQEKASGIWQIRTSNAP